MRLIERKEELCFDFWMCALLRKDQHHSGEPVQSRLPAKPVVLAPSASKVYLRCFSSLQFYPLSITIFTLSSRYPFPSKIFPPLHTFSSFTVTSHQLTQLLTYPLVWIAYSTVLYTTYCNTQPRTYLSYMLYSQKEVRFKCYLKKTIAKLLNIILSPNNSVTQ